MLVASHTHSLACVHEYAAFAHTRNLLRAFSSKAHYTIKRKILVVTHTHSFACVHKYAAFAHTRNLLRAFSSNKYELFVNY